MNFQTSTVISEEIIDEIIGKYQNKPGFLLSVLEEIQEKNPLKYLPAETLQTVAAKLNVPYSRIYGVVTFYSFFNLRPQGKHTIVVCRGTACHTKGSRQLLNEIGHSFGMNHQDDNSEASFTTADNQFTVRTVACFGQCAQSPVVEVDGKIYSYLNSQKLLKILENVKKNGFQKNSSIVKSR
ncbi:MAG TPA: NAD(P)H-dependent oxidoreductase subunit E [Paludibacteraceae bacterium]|nr:NAD(P)H-dependent oxidoreductase subunit E [Paludibacteraceae bacterium]